MRARQLYTVATTKDDERAILAAKGGEEKSAYVREIFSEIAPRYDLLNHILSLNVDRVWRRRAIAELRVEQRPEGRYLDLCAGTLEVTAAITVTQGFRGRVVSVDFAEPMLRAGLRKVAGRPVGVVAGDAMVLPIAASSIAGAIVAFGIRNVGDLDSCLKEAVRVLEPGGRFVILEFSTPGSPLVNAGYQLYFRRILPLLGGFISGHRTAYSYLPRSVANFPSREELARRMRGAGFEDVRWRSLTLGIVAIHTGTKGNS